LFASWIDELSKQISASRPRRYEWPNPTWQLHVKDEERTRRLKKEIMFVRPVVDNVNLTLGPLPVVACALTSTEQSRRLFGMLAEIVDSTGREVHNLHSAI
jgi:hypothetical protein